MKGCHSLRCSAAASQRHGGFTYVGLLILLAIMAVTITNSLRQGSALQRREKEHELLLIGLQFHTAFRTYYQSTPAGKSPYPTSLEDLVRDTRGPVMRRHIRKIYVDPVSGKDWVLIAGPGGVGISGVHSISEDPPQKNEGFPDELSELDDKTKYSEWIFGYDVPTK